MNLKLLSAPLFAVTICACASAQRHVDFPLDLLEHGTQVSGAEAFALAAVVEKITAWSLGDIGESETTACFRTSSPHHFWVREVNGIVYVQHGLTGGSCIEPGLLHSHDVEYAVDPASKKIIGWIQR